MKRTLMCVFAVFYLGLAPTGAADGPCNATIVKMLRDSLLNASNSLITKFYATFDTSCIRDPEYNEWSNPLVFDLFDKRTESAVQLLQSADVYTQNLVLRELGNPINREINVDALAKKVTDLKQQSRFKTRVLVALKKSTRFHVVDTMEEE